MKQNIYKFSQIYTLNYLQMLFANQLLRQPDPLAAVQSSAIVASGFNPHDVHINFSTLLSKKLLYNDWKYGCKCTPIICT